MLKQPQYQPMPMEEQVASVYACTPASGRPSWVRHLELGDLGRYERDMLAYLRSNHGDLLGNVRTTGALSEEDEQKLAAALDAFGNVFQPTGKSEAAA